MMPSLHGRLTLTNINFKQLINTNCKYLLRSNANEWIQQAARIQCSAHHIEAAHIQRWAPEKDNVSKQR
ncbi:hypothetical protein DBR45_07660 [Pseudomonas sp. HMWF031]|nr:hypothetical protein DBR45_07660 [Pseudomonas sp. HMWF031]